MVRVAIDLTLSDDEHEVLHLYKRSRSTAPEASSSDVVIMRDTADSDVEDISPQEFKEAVAAATGKKAGGGEEAESLEDDDIVITASYGQAATRDMPHPRPDCGVHSFTTGTSKSNSSHCSNCFCYVCDVKASECEFWGTGARTQDHANAMPKAYWDRLRQAAKVGDKAKLAAKFNTHTARKSKRMSRRSSR
ncbi:hypothetical protein Agub_g1116 [Astrephomene gubernaculifera]|uniref:Uncharacterized protein n=1 Tax=Astrephomene gubernaculifera TaxID=47775 RepID=A0AAD3DFA6_9CHLO|nr:hypothetical protein Agub_g1116 [Astrephomene gubernaculifera]